MSTYKRFPAFGKMLFKLRQVGKIPAQIVMVVFDWSTAITYPRIVIPIDMHPELLRFDYLTGLPVQIVFHIKDAHRVDSVIQEIIKIEPSFLSTFALDLVDSGKAIKLIKPYEQLA